MSRSLTQREFILKAKEKHVDFYDYSKVNYIGNRYKVTITCPLHGDFKQFSSGHLAGKGCQKCFNKKLAKVLTKTTEDFIEKSVKIHGNKYDYSLVVYNHCMKKVVIICKDHGQFLQTPSSHWDGKGCKKCSKTALKTTETFIKESKDLFPDSNYSYEKTEYKGNKIKVIITCNKEGHGDFSLKPNSHLSKKSGCPKCAKLARKGYWTKDNFVKRCKDSIGTFYVIKVFEGLEEFIKIGITSRDVKSRYCDQKRGVYEYEVLKVIECDPGTVYDLEKFNLKNLKKFKYKPLKEFQGHTECFTLECLPFIRYELENKLI
jgi:hypothetical protein